MKTTLAIGAAALISAAVVSAPVPAQARGGYGYGPDYTYYSHGPAYYPGYTYYPHYAYYPDPYGPRGYHLHRRYYYNHW